MKPIAAIAVALGLVLAGCSENAVDDSARGVQPSRPLLRIWTRPSRRRRTSRCVTSTRSRRRTGKQRARPGRRRARRDGAARRLVRRGVQGHLQGPADIDVRDPRSGRRPDQGRRCRGRSASAGSDESRRWSSASCAKTESGCSKTWTTAKCPERQPAPPRLCEGAGDVESAPGAAERHARAGERPRRAGERDPNRDGQPAAAREQSPPGGVHADGHGAPCAGLDRQRRAPDRPPARGDGAS